MTTTKKLNARESLIAFVESHGWELNPAQTVRSNSNIYSSERVQDPNAFRKADGEGGFWAIELNYNVKGQWNTTDTRLRSVELSRLDADGKVVKVTPSGDLYLNLDPSNADNYSRSINYQLWHVTSGISATPTLKQRAEVIIAAPALVVWLAVEGQAQRIAEIEEDNRRRAAERKARKRPLPITVTRDEYSELTWALDRAVSRARYADGLTDLPVVLEDIQAALDALKAVVKVKAEVLS